MRPIKAILLSIAVTFLSIHSNAEKSTNATKFVGVDNSKVKLAKSALAPVTATLVTIHAITAVVKDSNGSQTTAEDEVFGYDFSAPEKLHALTSSEAAIWAYSHPKLTLKGTVDNEDSSKLLTLDLTEFQISNEVLDSYMETMSSNDEITYDDFFRDSFDGEDLNGTISVLFNSKWLDNAKKKPKGFMGYVNFLGKRWFATTPSKR